MIALLDVNLLVALAWPNHVHHRQALAWFLDNQPLGWATCSVTQSGFIRVSSNQSALPDAKSPQEALLLLRRIATIDGKIRSLVPQGFSAQEVVSAILASP
jgi:predicted nucleic acid-binding protein